MRLEFETNLPSISVADPAVVETSHSASVADILSAGIRAAQSGDRREARRLLLDVTEADPRNENAWLWLASISEYPEELLAFLKNVLEINPNNERAVQWDGATRTLLAKTLTQRGIDASNRGDREQALQSFQQALDYDRQNAIAWLWMASLTESEELKLEYLEKAAAIDPSDENAAAALRLARANAAALKLKHAKADAVAGRRDDARRALDRILEAAPDLEDAWMLKSHLAESFDEKISALERALEINPNNFAARAGLDSLMAIVETVAPNADAGPAFTPAELSLESDFASVHDQATIDGHDSEIADSSDSDLDPGMVTYHFDSEAEVLAELANSQPDFADDNRLPLYLQDIDHTEHESTGQHFSESPIEDTEAVGDAAAEVNNQESSDDGENESLSVHEFFDSSVSDPYELSPMEDHEVYETSIISQKAEDAVTVSKKILLVDDNPTIRKLVSGKLERAGYDVVCAEDGNEAIEMLSQATPDLVLLDAVLPGANGTDICRWIRSNEQTRDLPIIIVLEKDDMLDDNLASDVNGFLIKPFGPDALMKTIRPLIDRAD